MVTVKAVIGVMTVNTIVKPDEESRGPLGGRFDPNGPAVRFGGESTEVKAQPQIRASRTTVFRARMLVEDAGTTSGWSKIGFSTKSSQENEAAATLWYPVMSGIFHFGINCITQPPQCCLQFW